MNAFSGLSDVNEFSNHKGYGYRILLSYPNGGSNRIAICGFKTLTDAESNREETISNHQGRMD